MSRKIYNLGAGLNLGNRFSCHPYATLGIPKEGSAWQTAWGAQRITKAYIQKIRQHGFHTVKLPVTWYPHLSESEKTISPWFMKQLREVIQWILEEDMFCIVSSHHDADWIESGNREEVKDKYCSMWNCISNALYDLPDSVLYESLNEVGYNEFDPNWTSITYDLNQICYQTVRGREGYSRTIIMEGKWSDIFTTYMEFGMQEKYQNIMIGVHFYEPWKFTIPKEGYDVTVKYDEAAIKERLNTLSKIKEKYHIPVIMTETGCNLYHRDKSYLLNWLRLVYNACAENGVPVMLWDNGLSGESLINPSSYEFEYPEIKEIIRKFNSTLNI